jgi:D-tyrosyl-tRNA(Tyr) deacylase
MRVLIQRSSKASVSVDNKAVGSIPEGLVLLVGFTEGDDLAKIVYLVKKIINLRIFPDNNGIMNKSILDYGGSILSISQFTLYADASKGNRPSYTKALAGTEAKILYDLFNQELAKYVQVASGIFGADMEVNFTNIGPTTIWLER